MVLGRFAYFLKQHSILSLVQAGFRSGRSLWIRFFSSHSQSQIPFTNLNQAHVRSSPLWILRKILTQFGILLSPINSSLWVFHSALSNGYDLISQIAFQKSASVIPIVVLSFFKEVFPKVQFLDQSFSLYLSMIFLLFSPHLLGFHSMQMTLPFGPHLQMLSVQLNVQLPQSKLPSTDW